ncbi:ABC transporter permease [Micromonospora sp. NPDC048835]|uniref:ABC transporter permease n=1 Tax=Micromonospora sp. NPDC048835 TaxID=3155147 RepID=UPI0033F8A659
MSIGDFRSPHIWAVPVIMIALLSLALPACYLSGITDPQANLRQLPVALVLEPQQSATTPGVDAGGAAESVAAAVESGTDPEKIRIVVMSATEMTEAFRDNDIYGAVVVPADFERGLSGLVAPPPGTTPSRPVVTIVNNAGDGNLAAGLVSANVTPALTAVQRTLGERLGSSADSYRGLALREPFVVRTAPDHALPPKSGAGLTPFYLALVTILIGFIGASTIHPSIDSAIGFAPSEVGPMTSRRPYRRATRTMTLLAKLAVLVAVAPIAAALLQLVATTVIGVSIGQPLAMWLLLSGAIAAVGVGALSVFAIFGAPGALINTFFFVALSLASGPAVPAEALPGWLRTLTSVTPMQPILDGVRAMLFFDGRGEAGLTHGWTRIGIGAATGLALGILTTWLYDRSPRFSRHPAAQPPAVA